ncbi:hypothetical protein [Fundidesulfovibrio butyratiphilus]
MIQGDGERLLKNPRWPHCCKNAKPATDANSAWALWLFVVLMLRLRAAQPRENGFEQLILAFLVGDNLVQLPVPAHDLSAHQKYDKYDKQENQGVHEAVAEITAVHKASRMFCAGAPSQYDSIFLHVDEVRGKDVRKNIRSQEKGRPWAAWTRTR